MDGETICAVATPRGEGAIAVLRLSGPQALAILERLTRAPRRPRELCYRRLRHPESGQLLDAVMVVWMPGPGSFTGEDVVEIHAHGGQLNVDRLERTLWQLGARAAEPGEFSRRAFVNGKLDLTQVEAIAGVISATSERALDNAQRLLDGALGQALLGVRQSLLAVAADLEACIDFVEDVEVAGERIRAGLEVGAEIERLVESYEVGRKLGALSVALVGPVNAGKSSLFNCLIGRDRAVVSRVAGTTRDYLEASVLWDGLRVELIDTAGERPSEQMDELEQAGFALGRARVEETDLVVWVVDGERGGEVDPRADLIVINKCDRLEPDARANLRRRLGAGVPVVEASAAERDVGALREAVITALRAEDTGEALVVTRARQQEALSKAARDVAEAARGFNEGLPPEVVVEPVRGALESLDAVTGSRYTEDVLDQLFAGFCIGK